MDFHSETPHKARKAYTCCATGLHINPGERYMRYVGVYEGDFYCNRMSMLAARMFGRHNTKAWRRGGEGLPFDGLVESVLSELDNEPTHEDVRDASRLLRLYPDTHAQRARLQLAVEAAVEAMNNRVT